MVDLALDLLTGRRMGKMQEKRLQRVKGLGRLSLRALGTLGFLGFGLYGFGSRA